MKKIILFSILAVCIIAAGVFTTLIVRELIIDRQSQSFYEDIAAEVERRPEPVITDNTQSEQPDDTASWKPYVDFNALNDEFPGIVGWIKLEDTPIDYPVMQYADNDYFLTRLPDGTLHRNGSIFLDYRNNNDFSDKSILIYGHETRAGDMFGALKNYRNQEFYEANQIINLYTPEKDFEIILFAGHVAHSIRDHPPMEFESDDDFLNYIEHLKSISVFKSNTEVSASDRIVSLVTCTYDFNDARLIIVGKIVEN